MFRALAIRVARASERALVIFAIVALIVPMTPSQASSLADAQRMWAEAIFLRVSPTTHDREMTSSANDEFGPRHYRERFSCPRAVSPAGTFLETAGKGSIWIYDRVHGIAEGTDPGGDAGGTTLTYAAPPPGHVADKNLAGIASARGLRLGVTPATVIRILGLPRDAEQMRAAGDGTIYTRKTFVSGGYTCSHEEFFVFKHGSAVSIALLDAGP